MTKHIVIVVAVVLSSPGVAQTTTYQYDVLGRLSGSTVTANGSAIGTTITYDNAGNRASYKVMGAPSGGSTGGGSGVGGGSGSTDSGAGA